jgi:acetyl esterase
MMNSGLSADPRLDPQYLDALALAADAGVWPADPLTMPLADARRQAETWHAFWKGDLPAVAMTVEHVVRGPAGPVPLRLFYPRRRAHLPVLVYFHGGGFALNSLATHERLMREIAVRAGIAVCGVGYSLAPEWRFPTQLGEAIAAIKWLRQTAPSLGLSSAAIAVGGDSAGANLALSAAIELRDRGEEQVAAAVLFYGMYAPEFDTASHRAYGGGDFGLTTARMRWFWKSYLPQPVQRLDPRAAPLHADLAGLPPILSIAAGLDCLLDDSLRLGQRLAAAGVPYRLSIYDGMPHSFLLTDRLVDRAGEALDEVAAMLRRLHEPFAVANWADRGSTGVAGRAFPESSPCQGEPDARWHEAHPFCPPRHGRRAPLPTGTLSPRS